jgi:hypothetical protein
MYSAWDITVREIGGGIWFFTSLAGALAFLGYALRRTLWERQRPDVVILTAFALAEFFIGSAMRGFLTWMQFMSAGNGGDTAPWIATWPLLGSSVILNILGAAACIWLLSPRRWRAWFTAATVVIAIGVPLGLFWLA